MAPAVDSGAAADIAKLSLNGGSNGKTQIGRSDMQLGEVTHHNVLQLKKLNQCVFPVSYNDKFYKEVTSAGELARLAYFNDVVVGAVCCREDKYEGEKSLYIMTLATLAPYRTRGVGRMLLEHVFALCEKDPAVHAVHLHVQINNEVALNFYSKFGFEQKGVVEHYYKRIEPDSAMEEPSGMVYLNGMQAVDDSVDEPSSMYPHFASLTAMVPSSIEPSASLLHHNFLLSAQSPPVFSPYRQELEWLERTPKDDDPSMAIDERSMMELSEMMERERAMDQGGPRRKRTWSERIAAESNDKKYQRMERNRIRMAEKRARETNEERRARLHSSREYMKNKFETETEEQRAKRKEINRVRTAIRRGKMAVERSLEDQLQSMLTDGCRDEIQEENGGERSKRLELAREYAMSRRDRETPEQRNARLTKNRERMRATRAGKAEEWRAFLAQREGIEDRLQLMRMQFGEKSPLLEKDSLLATKLAEQLSALAEAAKKRKGKGVSARDWDAFIVVRLPPILDALEDLLSSGTTSSEGEETFVFGVEASYLDYQLFEELDALFRLSPAILDRYPTLAAYRERIQQGLQLTTCALMQAGSALNLSCDPIDNLPYPTVPSEEKPQPFLMMD
ncbi:hypothetical protein PRIPAC_76325 [Pristionchus pacificus]|uniref:N-terminal methionine N(alpha)-acetyltransferase NatE n=1 Tax=Pristionchus pacificus TaxID=54126 RepID=A0A2A6CFQ1_PRIPA|nr:hypothetical protein PRIPAC_76325 [Pristionchus pacificus]|eukprot:PDM76841.1 Acetyltransferase [Pristionchus pacificus]